MNSAPSDSADFIGPQIPAEVEEMGDCIISRIEARKYFHVHLGSYYEIPGSPKSKAVFFSETDALNWIRYSHPDFVYANILGEAGQLRWIRRVWNLDLGNERISPITLHLPYHLEKSKDQIYTEASAFLDDYEAHTASYNISLTYPDSAFEKNWVHMVRFTLEYGFYYCYDLREYDRS
ncbi:MAG: hypothetical protein H7343_01450 [Undibacterium sp.]|nr:hypothetical protein [Opitutaceae bacterium]